MMWCSYCEKNDHSDEQCWCTRPVLKEQPLRIHALPFHATKPDAKQTLLSQAMAAVNYEARG